MNIRQRCGNIQQREISLYGDQNEIEIFLEKYSNVLNIQYVLTDHRDEVRLQSYVKWDVKTVMMEQAELSENSLIVICSRNKFDTLKRRLCYMRKEEYKDFISQELVESLLHGKKLIICMGTQLLEQVYVLLTNSEYVCREYDIVYYPESNLREVYKDRMVEYAHVSRYCDVYIRSACEKEQFPLKIIDTDIKNSDCKIITVADFGFGGYYPQIINNRDEISTYLLRGYARLPMSYETLAFSRTDKEIVNLCQQGVSEEDIVETLLNPKFYSNEAVQNYFHEQVERFRTLEKAADIRLGGYISQNKEEYLCRSLNEWNEPVISYVIERLSALIDLPELDMDQNRRIQLLEENSGSEILIYPSVQRALGLEELLKNKKYKVVTFYQSRHMIAEEYLRFMVEYLYKVKDIVRFTHMDDESLYQK